MKFKKEDPKFGCFSNFTPCTFVFDSVTYHNAEAAWQAQKTLDLTERSKFAEYTASTAKRAGRRVRLRPDWESVKYGLMVAVCYEKFKQNPYFMEVLLSTEDEEIVEDTTGWHDNIWGNCDCPRCANKVGQNLLGKALMEVRERLSNEAFSRVIYL